MKVVGQIVELDPTKNYIVLANPYDHFLYTAIENGALNMENGAIWFVEKLNNIRFVENSDRITDIIINKEV